MGGLVHNLNLCSPQYTAVEILELLVEFEELRCSLKFLGKNLLLCGKPNEQVTVLSMQFAILEVNTEQVVKMTSDNLY